MSAPSPESDRRPLTVAEALARGIAHHQAGQLQEAERLYRSILQVQPHHPDANHNLGVLAAAMGKATTAVAFFRAAVESNPQSSQYWISYMNALLGAGDIEGAAKAISLAEKHRLPPQLFAETKQNIASLRRAPPDAPNRLEEESLIAKYEQGGYAEAEALAAALTQRFPEHPFAWNVLAMARLELGKNEAALPAAQKALQLQPQLPGLHSNLGAILKALGRFRDAEASCRRALELQPDYFEAHLNLAKARQGLGRWEEAEASCRRAAATRPNSAEALRELSECLRVLGRLAEAEATCRRAIQLKPDLGEAHINLGSILADRERLEEAVASYQAGIQLRPNLAEAHNNLGSALKDLGRVDEAVASYRRALALKPALTTAHSNLLLCLNYLPQATAAESFGEHRHWGEQNAKPALDPSHHLIDKNPRRRLRIGFVSPDFRQHSVAYFFEPLLREIDRTVVEVSCYADVLKPDATTSLLQGLADHWANIVGLSDAEVAQRIIADRIDILVDLAGHTAGNRLSVFALKPAPIQLSWLGYPNTTGLPAMDYRLVDDITDPSSPADALAVERLVRLEKGFLCYAPPKAAPPPAVAKTNGPGITFGSFNNPAKISSHVLGAWANVLSRVPRSRLVLKGKPFLEPSSQGTFLARLRQHGIDAADVTLLGRTSSAEEHLSLYDQVDIALDTFPYNGTTTTCEALWMGVPVVTLRGDRHAGRVGASLLTQTGLPELIADSVEAYVELAANLAMHPERLTEYRLTFRDRVRQSPLCDAPAFARKMEAAFRDLWQMYCVTPPREG